MAHTHHLYAILSIRVKPETHDPGIRLIVAVAIVRGSKVLLAREEDQPYHKSWVLPKGAGPLMRCSTHTKFVRAEPLLLPFCHVGAMELTY